MDKSRIYKGAKWTAVGCIVTGFVIAGIGFFSGGLNTVNLLFWK